MEPRDMDAELKNHGGGANGNGAGDGGASAAAGDGGGATRGTTGNDSSSTEASKHGSKHRHREGKNSSRSHRNRDLDDGEQSNGRRRHHHRRDHGSSSRHHSRRHRHRSSRSRSRSASSGGRDRERSGRDRDENDDGSSRRKRHRSSSRRSLSKSRRGRQSRSRSPRDGKKRSKSKSKSKSPSPERSRSRSRSESKRPSGFDVMPAGSFSSSQAGVMMQPTSMTQQATRHARRVYVGGLPPLVNEQAIAAFFNQVMASVGGNSAGPGDAVVNVYINQEKRFAFVEMRSVEEASNAIALNGIFFNGIPVRVKRPSDYDREMAARLGPVDPSPHLNLASVGLEYRSLGPAEGPDRIFIGGLPYEWGEKELRKVTEPFGPLRGLEIVKDSTTGASKGYAFVVFQDASVTDNACQLLNNTRVGDKVLNVHRATVNGTSNVDLTPGSVQQPHQRRQGEQEPADIPSRIVCLSNAVSKEELKNDAEYGEIVEDMMEECGKFGELERVEIPRPSASGAPVPGLGKVFLVYKNVPAAIKAKCNLGGRKFAGKTVETRYYPEDRFAAKDYSL